MSDDNGKEDVTDADKELLKHKEHWSAFRPENSRCANCGAQSNVSTLRFDASGPSRPSYRDPSNPGSSESEIGVAYSQEEEMNGRLHDQMIKQQKMSNANLAASVA